jgi:hypothetical protein
MQDIILVLILISLSAFFIKKAAKIGSFLKLVDLVDSN